MNQRIRKIVSGWLIHFCIVWVVINLFTVIPYVYLASINEAYLFHEDRTPVTAWEYFLLTNFRFDMIMTGVYLLLVEINYQRYFKKLHWSLFAATCLLISILAFVMLVSRRLDTLKIMGALSAIKPIVIMAAYAMAYAMIRDYFYDVRRKKTMHLVQTQHELSALKAQLHPHFLFNSLNYLYGTALKENAPSTAEGIDRLSEMLRYTLTSMHESFVPLTEEIQFIQNYLSLQEVRLPDRNMLMMDVQISANEPDWKIAPLLLLPFIENAFKYGISTDEPSYVRLHLGVSNGYLAFEIVNGIIKGRNQVKGSNTGITSSIKRLELLYPNRYTFKSTHSDTDYSVTLMLQLSK